MASSVEGESATDQSVPDPLRSSLSVFAWIGAANVCLYGFSAALARLLDVDQYGLFAAVFGVVGLAGLALGGIQTAVARSVAGASPIEQGTAAALGSRAVCLLAAAVTAALLLASPLLAWMLDTDSIFPPVVAAVIIGLLIPWSALLGVLQGGSRMVQFGRFTFVQALLRLAALAVVVVTRNLSAILLAVAVAAAIANVLVLRGEDRSATPASLRSAWAWAAQRRGGLVAAFLVAIVVGFPTLGDVVIGRVVLDPDDAGLFAGVALIGRMQLFVTVSVTAVFYPRFIAGSDRQCRSDLKLASSLIGGAMALAVALTVVAPEFVLRTAVGEEYASQSRLLMMYVGYIMIHSFVSLLFFYFLARHRSAVVVRVLAGVLFLQFVIPLLARGSAELMAGAELGLATVLLAAAAVVFVASNRRGHPSGSTDEVRT